MFNKLFKKKKELLLLQINKVSLFQQEIANISAIK